MKVLALRARIPPDQRKNAVEPTLTLMKRETPAIRMYMTRGGMRQGF
jgi:hypothetical protein